jgi:membrane protease YdiL (CAAX protease family)
LIFERSSPQIVVNALLFASFHGIYPNPMFSMSLAFIAGLGFSTMYDRYPNLWLIAASHMALNYVGTLYCFLSFESSCSI